MRDRPRGVPIMELLCPDPEYYNISMIVVILVVVIVVVIVMVAAIISLV